MQVARCRASEWLEVKLRGGGSHERLEKVGIMANGPEPRPLRAGRICTGQPGKLRQAMADARPSATAGPIVFLQVKLASS